MRQTLIKLILLYSYPLLQNYNSYKFRTSFRNKTSLKKEKNWLDFFKK